MLKLVWKDLAVLRLPLCILIPLVVLQLTVTASLGPLFAMMALTFTVLLAFGPIALEDHQRTEILWASLPVTRRDIVLARYLSTVFGLLLGVGISWLSAAAARVLPAGGSAAPGLLTFASLLVLLLLMGAGFLPCYFRYGAGKGMLVFSAYAVGLLILLPLLMQMIWFLAGLSNPLLDPAAWRGRMPEQDVQELMRMAWKTLAVLGILAVAALPVSAGLALRFYERRDL